VPRVSEFYGIAIYMYWNDHAPPHFHAIYGDDEALIRIDDATVFAGSLPRTALRLVQEWAALHRDDLAENWELARRPEPLTPIAPLQ
jgi:hypothetical protein